MARRVSRSTSESSPALVAWRIVTLDADDSEAVSTAVSTREEALAWARDLIAKKTRVVRIQASDGRRLTPDGIAEIGTASKR